MKLSGVIDAVEALNDLVWGGRTEFPLRDEGFVAALSRAIPADAVSYLELDVRGQQTVEVVDVGEDGDDGDGDDGGDELTFWTHFWSSRICSYTESGAAWATTVRTVGDFYSDREWRSSAMYRESLRPTGMEWELLIPLPSPPARSRRIVLFRAPGRAFDDRDRSVGQVLRPHVVDAMRTHDRRRATALLTPRQRELLDLCARGLDNTRIARALDMSTGTVRKHLENTYQRLGVQSRGEAVAAVRPDLTWA